MEQNEEKKKPRFKFKITKKHLVILAFVVLLAGWAGTFGYDRFDDYSHENAEFCGSCHNMEYHLNSYSDSNHLDNVHMQAGVGCQDCHVEYTMAEKIKSGIQYVSGDFDKIPSKRKFDDQMCLNCHISMEHQAERTDFLHKNPHLSHWPDLRCGSCHLSHEPQINYCARCHENGGQRMTGEPIDPRSSNPWADPNAELPDVQ